MKTQDSIRAGRVAIKRAELWRAGARRRLSPRDPQRQSIIAGLIEQIDEAMKPIRSDIGRLLWHAEPRKHEAALRDVSKQLQYQRKQLKKMRRPDPTG